MPFAVSVSSVWISILENIDLFDTNDRFAFLAKAKKVVNYYEKDCYGEYRFPEAEDDDFDGVVLPFN